MPSRPKIIYFGTPDFAADILEFLHQDSTYEIAAVVTNPDARPDAARNSCRRR